MQLYLKLLVLIFVSTHCFATTTVKYFKCTTDRGIVFSQFPCSANATQHTITTSDPKASAPSEQHYKTLNNLERNQIAKRTKRALRAKHHEKAVLNRKRDTAVREQQDKLTKLMNEDRRKKVVRQVKKEIKAINKAHAKAIKSLEKEISKLEKQLKEYE
ncbi:MULTISPECIES: hypothetical protein [Pseudoalteromonas]|uniref:DUF4124 domain-containing protein n=1 Tax=Pseudoalteromonas piscicida TaxID=43662 RepID=A0AAQ2EXR7_PSEO7|nr:MULTISPECIES: hypothetical protein [Pseudoalteromonas]ATD06700.1 hypothetical protein PPIS_a1596 [Pseudoalteromonas piscicida]KID33245.1 hypothetical protein QT15_22710 [Pseudoalteromonas flavipulchra NCIMB 2033 = ATCC BAA-314]KJY88961.1 hypothetical protein TW75_11355 [Pseudoalteromonas piscicida]KJZ01467.1 hypothetical protein TW73_14375 [Pseudoalteromonas piscicida]MBD0781773.1 DUF4124 domain-containing protein [Pseudoalteromonas flavipulchra]